jgi:hypothetical protein
MAMLVTSKKENKGEPAKEAFSYETYCALAAFNGSTHVVFDSIPDVKVASVEADLVVVQLQLVEQTVSEPEIIIIRAASDKRVIIHIFARTIVTFERVNLVANKQLEATSICRCKNHQHRK